MMTMEVGIDRDCSSRGDCRGKKKNERRGQVWFSKLNQNNPYSLNIVLAAMLIYGIKSWIDKMLNIKHLVWLRM